MTTYKTDLSKLPIGQLVLLTGYAHNTLKRRLHGLEPVAKSGRAIYYDTQAALRRIYNVEESEKERLDRLRGDRVDHDLSISKGEHLPIADVESLMIEAAAIFAGQSRSLGSRLAGELAGMNNPKKIMKLLNSENDKILSNLAVVFSEAKA